MTQEKIKRRGRFWVVVIASLLALGVTGVWSVSRFVRFEDYLPWAEGKEAWLEVAEPRPIPEDAAEIASLVLEGARAEAVKQTPYIMEYREIAYPMGDVPEGTGVCTDLIVRAFRHAGIDLQEQIHEDRLARLEAYPKPKYFWQSNDANPNIDHRRCRNMQVWFAEFAEELPTASDETTYANWKSGDVVFFSLKGKGVATHVAIVSDMRDKSGEPFLIDSMPPSAGERHRLNQYERHYDIHSHYRIRDVERLKKKIASSE